MDMVAYLNTRPAVRSIVSQPKPRPTAKQLFQQHQNSMREGNLALLTFDFKAAKTHFENACKVFDL
jgi:hypothetical protein